MPSEPELPGLDEDESSDLDDLLSDETGPRPEDILAGVGAGAGAAVAERRKRGRLVPVSDQERMAIEREQKAEYPRSRPSRMPLILGVMALLIALVGVSYVAVEHFNVMTPKQAEPIALAPEPLPVLKPPAVTQQGYVMSGTEQVTRPDPYQRQAEVSKIRFRQTIRSLAEAGGTWWSPWRVLREVGGSVDGLVGGRTADDVLEAFDVDRSAVEAGLRSRRTLNYLAGVGFDLRGKDPEDLSARETFELLSAREIKDTDQIENVISSLLDKLATDRSEQARRRAQDRKTGESASLDLPRKGYHFEADRAAIVQVQPRHQAGAKAAGADIRGSPTVPNRPTKT